MALETHARRGAIVAILAAFVASAQTPQRHPITFKDMISMHRVSDPEISPDGKWIAYTLATPDMNANGNSSDVWIVSAQGGTPTQLTRGGHDNSAVWAPDSKSLAFLSSRSGKSQVHLLSMEGGEATQLTKLSTGADLVKWSPDGKMLLFTSSVYPDCKDDPCNSSRDSERDKNKVKAHVADHLLYRHWTHWNDGKRSHLFVMNVEGDQKPRDLTSGADYDVPPDQRGGPPDIAFSPDSKEICFTAVTDKVEATSTNADLFVVPVGGGEPKRITTNPGFDGSAAYSPDGRFIAYRSQATPGYESDHWRLMLYDRSTQQHSEIAPHFDRNPDGAEWSADSHTIYFSAEDETLSPVYAVAAQPGSEPKKVIADGFNSELKTSADGKTLIFARSSWTAPEEVFAAASDGSDVRQLTHHNADILANLEMNPPETFWFEGAAGTRVEAMLIRPAHFDASKKYPLLVLLHGGPQTMWSNAWGYRWNAQVFASPGYVVLMINRRGSTGYGQKFTNEITGDWGGKAFEDIMTGIDYTISNHPFVDATRTAAAGASYGGYMADWLATHTGRFKAIISHAGVYDPVSMYATEELWFQDHDMQGTPWSNPEGYRKLGPVTYAGELGKYKTPTLVIAGELDFRVPYTQSLEFFSALQRQDVPSKLVVFPDEGHWILKPQNSEFWYKTVLDWLAAYLK